MAAPSQEGPRVAPRVPASAQGWESSRSDLKFSHLGLGLAAREKGTKAAGEVSGKKDKGRWNVPEGTVWGVCPA